MLRSVAGSRSARLAVRTFQTLALLVLATTAVALSTRPEGEIPETEQNVSGEILDRSQTRTIGDHLSVDGVTYFSVLRGETTIFVPFAKLKAIEAVSEVKSDDGVDRVEATFTFLDGTSERGLLRSRQILYGSSKFGNFQLKLRDVLSIRFVNSAEVGAAARPS
jgi:hypothetical protein